MLFMALVASVAVGCDEVCAVGECGGGGPEECFEECLEVCEGDVIDAFCSVDFICECDCELGCFFD